MFALSRVVTKSKSLFTLSANFAKVAGNVKFFDVTKGFGFITPKDGSDDVFVHQSQIHAEGFRSLADGEEVEFTVEVDPKRGKAFATNVTGPNGEFVQGAPRKTFQSRNGYNDGSRRGFEEKPAGAPRRRSNDDFDL